MTFFEISKSAALCIAVCWAFSLAVNGSSGSCSFGLAFVQTIVTGLLHASAAQFPVASGHRAIFDLSSSFMGVTGVHKLLVLSVGFDLFVDWLIAPCTSILMMAVAAGARIGFRFTGTVALSRLAYDLEYASAVFGGPGPLLYGFWFLVVSSCIGALMISMFPFGMQLLFLRAGKAPKCTAKLQLLRAEDEPTALDTGDIRVDHVPAEGAAAEPTMEIVEEQAAKPAPGTSTEQVIQHDEQPVVDIPRTTITEVTAGCSAESDDGLPPPKAARSLTEPAKQTTEQHADDISKSPTPKHADYNIGSMRPMPSFAIRRRILSRLPAEDISKAAPKPSKKPMPSRIPVRRPQPCRQISVPAHELATVVQRTADKSTQTDLQTSAGETADRATQTSDETSKDVSQRHGRRMEPTTPKPEADDVPRVVKRPIGHTISYAPKLRMVITERSTEYERRLHLSQWLHDVHNPSRVRPRASSSTKPAAKAEIVDVASPAACEAMSDDVVLPSGNSISPPAGAVVPSKAEEDELTRHDPVSETTPVVLAIDNGGDANHASGSSEEPPADQGSEIASNLALAATISLPPSPPSSPALGPALPSSPAVTATAPGPSVPAPAAAIVPIAPLPASAPAALPISSAMSVPLAPLVRKRPASPSVEFFQSFKRRKIEAPAQLPLGPILTALPTQPQLSPLALVEVSSQATPAPAGASTAPESDQIMADSVPEKNEGTHMAGDEPCVPALTGPVEQVVPSVAITGPEVQMEEATTPQKVVIQEAASVPEVQMEEISSPAPVPSPTSRSGPSPAGAAPRDVKTPAAFRLERVAVASANLANPIWGENTFLKPVAEEAKQPDQKRTVNKGKVVSAVDDHDNFIWLRGQIEHIGKGFGVLSQPKSSSKGQPLLDKDFTIQALGVMWSVTHHMSLLYGEHKEELMSTGLLELAAKLRTTAILCASHDDKLATWFKWPAHKKGHGPLASELAVVCGRVIEDVLRRAYRLPGQPFELAGLDDVNTGDRGDRGVLNPFFRIEVASAGWQERVATVWAAYVGAVESFDVAVNTAGSIWDNGAISPRLLAARLRHCLEAGRWLCDGWPQEPNRRRHSELRRQRAEDAERLLGMVTSWKPEQSDETWGLLSQRARALHSMLRNGGRALDVRHGAGWEYVDRKDELWGEDLAIWEAEDERRLFGDDDEDVEGGSGAAVAKVDIARLPWVEYTANRYWESGWKVRDLEYRPDKAPYDKDRWGQGVSGPIKRKRDTP